MKIQHFSVVFIVFLFSGLLFANSHDVSSGSKDKTLSPYFFVKSDDPSIDQLPLKSTDVHVDIAGIIANVAVTQVYKNTGKRPIEAIYVFPASTRAAVYAMKMTIGKRTIVAKIKERKQARQAYEHAKAQGKTASLLEQQRPNVFQMNVANILPGDVIRVEMKYTENLVPTDGIYNFVYPTVVGPRYSNAKVSNAPKSEGWISNPYTHQGKAPTSTFDIYVNIMGGMPITDVKCPSHKVKVSFDGPATALVRLADTDKYEGNRDFILKYRLKGRKVRPGLLLYHGKDENFFLAMLQPPKRVTPKQISRREYIFIVDVSGSMNGFPLKISKRLLRKLIGSLRHSDMFNVLLFAGTSALLSSKSLPANKLNIKRAIRFIDAQRGGGGTELLSALQRALKLPRIEGVSRTIVIATDGYVSIERQAFDLIRKYLGRANFFAFGIGSSVNRFLIEGIARVGMGEPFIVTRPGTAEAAAKRFRKYVLSPVLTSIKISTPGFDTYNVVPQNIPDLFARRPVIVFGKYHGKAEGRLVLQGLRAHGRFRSVINVSDFRPNPVNNALKYLWARHEIAQISDYASLSGQYGKQDDRKVLKHKIIDLSLKYNLLTRYTSFVAIDRRIRIKNGKAVTVKQPLPMPGGVSDNAIGDRAAEVSGGFRRQPMLARPRILRVKGLKHVHPIKHFHRCRIRKIHLQGHNKSIGIGVIKRIIHRKMHNLMVCCRQFAKNRHGKVMVVLIIDKTGRVLKVHVRNITKFAGSKKCFIRSFKHIRFPASNKKFRIKFVLTY